MDYMQNIADSIEFLLAFISLLSFVFLIVGLFGYFFTSSSKTKRYYLMMTVFGFICLAVVGPDLGIRYFRIRV